jgi:two-component system, NarL family, invasion response regulator UvrY
MTVRVLVADDQAPFRAAARSVLGAAAGFRLVGEAVSGEEAVDLAESLQPDLVLMDIEMVGIGGIEATRRIAAGRPAPVTILLSTYREQDLPHEARTCGAAAYVPKAEFGSRVLRELWADLPTAAPPDTGARP